MDGVMKELLLMLFQIANDEKLQKEVFRILVDNHFISNSAGQKTLFPKDFTLYDDSWLKTLISNINQHLKQVKEERKITTLEEKLLLFSDTILFRKSVNLISLWKSEIEARKFVEHLHNETGIHINDIANYLNNKTGTTTFDLAVRAIKTELSKENTYLINHACTAKIYDPEKKLFILHKNVLYPLNYASNYITSLEKVKATTIEPRFAFIKENLKNGSEPVEKTFERLSEKIYKKFKSYIESAQAKKITGTPSVSSAKNKKRIKPINVKGKPNLKKP